MDAEFATTVRSRLNEQERVARTLRPSRDQPAPTPRSEGASFAKGVRKLTRITPDLSDIATSDGAEVRIVKQAAALRVEDVEKLLQRPTTPPPTVSASGNEIILASAGARHSIRPEGRSLFRVGEAGFELWVAPPASLSAARWLHARRLDAVRVTANERDRKQASARIVLYGSQTDNDVKEVHGELVAEVRRGSPVLKLDLKIVNDGAPYDLYAFLTPGYGWQTDPSKGTLSAQEAPDQRQVPWVYLHRTATGGGGVLLSRLPSVGKSGSGSYIFGWPRTQRIPTGGAFDLSVAACPLHASAADDAFLAERLENVRLYSSLAAQLVTGIHLDAQWERAPAPGSPGLLRARLIQSGADRADKVSFQLTGKVGGERVSCKPSQGATATEAVFEVTVPVNTPAGAGLELWPEVDVTLANGEKMVLRSLVVQKISEAVQIVSQSLQWSDAEGETRAIVAVRSNLATAISGRVMLSPPTGWTATPTEQEIEIAPGQNATVGFLVRGPGGARNALGKATLALTVGDGAPQKLSWPLKLSPHAIVSRAATAPTIDGDLSEACWQQAVVLRGFVNIEDGRSASEATTARVLAGSDGLYVAVRCEESRMDELRDLAVADETRTSPKVPQDDSIEVYVRPRLDSTELFRFAVNCSNVRKSEAGANWESATKKGDKFWTVEVAIPYSTLQTSAPKASDVWGLNVCRNEQRLQEFSAWSCTYGSYHQPDMLGWAKFQ